jgi:hypothetical protein
MKNYLIYPDRLKKIEYFWANLCIIINQDEKLLHSTW